MPHDSSPRTEPVPELVPARMLNEFCYCPRLGYLEWVHSEFADNSDTVEGRYQHRRVDREAGKLPEPGQEPESPVHATSVMLSAPEAGIIARMDLVEAEGTHATPVDYKRGSPPDNPERCWEPERVQLCAQALVLEENGYQCDVGLLYFVAAKQRIEVALDDSLRQRTLSLVTELRQVMRAPVPPLPLVDSPKCPRCSLNGICLPDEVNLVANANANDEAEPRRLIPARDDALPLLVHTGGTRVSKSGDELVVTKRDGTKQQARLGQTSHVALFGAVQVTTQAVQALLKRSIPVSYFSGGGWFYGMTRGLDHKNVELRRWQFRVSEDEAGSLVLAKRFVTAKLRNCRTMLRRNAKPAAREELRQLRELIGRVESAPDAPFLLGLEGTAARCYFSKFAHMVRSGEAGSNGVSFDFTGRNRRPPRDPVNALLSFAYALLTKDVTLALAAVGFDPLLGFYHRPRYGRPALALDMMEEFRPLIGDSVVLSAINNGVVTEADFVCRGGAVALCAPGRGRFLRAYERRMDELVTHPVFGYRISYRRVLEVQARLLARYLSGEIPELPAFVTR